ncbi:MAG: tRNA pseudouridine(38-40) synthase TruA [Erysipelotrichia bacterium]|jgi:tRNA pseudouridine38-40 synthase|nr:tRNA pseudouridine(38-40) synthase TruA [Erysipelotrichia bacterium]
MARLKITMSFLGYHFEGWQKIKGKRTIQATIEHAVSMIDDHSVSVTGCGRTDKHVSADHYVCHVDVKKDLTSAQWLKAINAHTPEDLHVLDVEIVDEDFHARFSVKKKLYVYTIRRQNYQVKNYMHEYFHRYPLDPIKIKEAAKSFVGTHDFTGFNVTPKQLKENQIRTIDACDVDYDDEVIRISVLGKAFLQYQVRMMVGALIAIGSDKEDVSFIEHVLKQKQKGISRFKAEAKGLTLKEVFYD